MSIHHDKGMQYAVDKIKKAVTEQNEHSKKSIPMIIKPDQDQDKKPVKENSVMLSLLSGGILHNSH
jgi:superoxide dismutase